MAHSRPLEAPCSIECCGQDATAQTNQSDGTDPGATPMARLLGRLARFGWVQRRGEVIATHALSCLLEEDRLREVLLSIGWPDAPVSASSLTFAPEAQLESGGRADLEGSHEGAPVVIVEAKFESPLVAKQLGQYLEEQQQRLRRASKAHGALVALVPESRRREVEAVTRELLPDSRRQIVVGEGVSTQLRVISWEELLEGFADACADTDMAQDVAQLQSLCDQLSRLGFDPLTREDLREWEGRLEDFVSIVDRVSAQIAERREAVLYPIQHNKLGLRAYRYVGPEAPYLAIALREPTSGQAPLAVLYHKDTARFADVVRNLERSRFAPRIARLSDNLLIELDPTVGVSATRVTSDLVEQVSEIDIIARTGTFGESPTPA